MRAVREPPLQQTEMWTLQDSNLPPPACKAGALPDELRAHTNLKLTSVLPVMD